MLYLHRSLRDIGPLNASLLTSIVHLSLTLCFWSLWHTGAIQARLLLLFFFTPVLSSRGMKKLCYAKKNQAGMNGHYSSSALTKLSCRRMALKRWIIIIIITEKEDCWSTSSSVSGSVSERNQTSYHATTVKTPTQFNTLVILVSFKHEHRAARRALDSVC